MTLQHQSPSRRRFLAGATAAAGMGAAAPLTTVRAAFAQTPPEAPDADVLVVLFLRGGIDGLNTVAPFQMPSYRTLRPTLRVKAPDEVPTGAGALPLTAAGTSMSSIEHDGVFGFHPGMEALHQGAWADGKLAIVPAVGLPATEHPTRSHFEAEMYWERGSANLGITDGFLSRYLAGFDTSRGLPAVSKDVRLPWSLRGSQPAYTMPFHSLFGVSNFAANDRVEDALAKVYDDTLDSAPLVTTGARALRAASLVEGVDFSEWRYLPQNGAAYPGTWWSGTGLREAAQLIRTDLGIRVITIDMIGWDTHQNQGVPEQSSGNHFRTMVTLLSDTLQAFYTDLGSEMDRVTVVTLSEFGRTIHENSSGGTDHGRAGLMLAMGNGINGGIWGDFPDQIVDGPEDDLPVLVDYRTVMAEILRKRGGTDRIRAIFPTYTEQPALGLARPRA